METAKWNNRCLKSANGEAAGQVNCCGGCETASATQWATHPGIGQRHLIKARFRRRRCRPFVVINRVQSGTRPRDARGRSRASGRRKIASAQHNITTGAARPAGTRHRGIMNRRRRSASGRAGIGRPSEFNSTTRPRCVAADKQTRRRSADSGVCAGSSAPALQYTAG